MSARKLHVSAALSLPHDVVTSTLVVYGGKGMGKTNFGNVLVEELDAAGLRFSVLDPMGVWWGLRHSADGKGPGIKVLILGGVYGDIPIEPTGGAVVADLVVDEDANVVIDISRRADGTMWSIGERVRFVADYCKRLYQRQGEKRRPILQLLDEAARFCPQIIRKGDDAVAVCMGAVAVLVEEGRNVAVGVCLITQRSARLNKDVAELADCMIAFRTVGPNSRRAVMDWLGEHVEKDRLKDLDDRVRALPRGSALVVSPGWLEYEGVVAMRARQTFDSSATPKSGQERRTSGPGAKPDLAKYQQRMAATIEKAKAENPKELQRQIADLKRQLAAKVPKVATQVMPQRVEVAVLKNGQIGALERIVLKIEKLAAPWPILVNDLRDVATALRTTVQKAGAPGRPSHLLHSGGLQPVRGPSGGRIGGPKADRPVPSPDARLTGPEQRILDAIAWMEAIGVGEPEQAAVAFLAGYTYGGGAFNNPKGKLRSQGLVTYRGDRIALTEAGRAIAQVPDAPLTTMELQKRVMDRLPRPEQRILGPLLLAYPDSLTKQELAERAEYTHGAGAFNNPLGRLRSLGLIDYPEAGRVIALPVLFLETYIGRDA